MAKEKAVYVCEGTCKAEISEARYNAGLKSCGDPSCTLHGKPFRKKIIRS